MDSKVTKHEERQGLASIVGKWKDFEEVKVQIDDLARLRKDAGPRTTRYGDRQTKNKTDLLTQRPEADPILDVICTIDAEPFAEDIDDTLYREL